ncbi:MAG: hypothetical protein KatS3mg105_2958 [Gemmatales bacterium]|nr:MAG: hypothetical protein KatS3mg105_2958 [Gemmatales bacterium]
MSANVAEASLQLESKFFVAASRLDKPKVVRLPPTKAKCEHATLRQLSILSLSQRSRETFAACASFRHHLVFCRPLPACRIKKIPKRTTNCMPIGTKEVQTATKRKDGLRCRFIFII